MLHKTLIQTDLKLCKKEHSKTSTLDALCSVITELLEEEVKRETENGFDIFYSKTAPKIGISDYIKRIVNLSEMEESTFIYGFVLLDAFCNSNNIGLTKFNVYRLTLSALIVALKMNEDYILKSNHYAKIGGLKPEILCELELSFVCGIDFKLNLTIETYESYKKLLKSD